MTTRIFDGDLRYYPIVHRAYETTTREKVTEPLGSYDSDRLTIAYYL